MKKLFLILLFFGFVSSSSFAMDLCSSNKCEMKKLYSCVKQNIKNVKASSDLRLIVKCIDKFWPPVNSGKYKGAAFRIAMSCQDIKSSYKYRIHGSHAIKLVENLLKCIEDFLEG